MNGNIFLRTGVVLLLFGIAFGIYMGMTQDFTYAPAHAHLNLVGGVLMFLAGLFYNSRPAIPSRAIAVHYVVHLAGAVLLTIGIYGSITHTPWSGPVVGTGAFLTLAALCIFAWRVFRSGGPAIVR
ncbi:MAG: hypothetical protein JWL98_263 [Xanthomonadaceae bacterium]|nr:hypothetical protein [Xanthomonadaceae bacterium]